MQTIEIQGRTGESKILVGESLDDLHQYIPDGRAVIITDATVAALYRDRFPSLPTVVIGTGESIKRLETVAQIFREFIDFEIDRDTFVIGIGGGIVCDITGFAASTFMRGLSFGFVPTTLLAQVDASVGGKNGVNFDGFKNMVGLFNQPRFVLCDPGVLQTLSRSDVANGLAEVVKHTLIADRNAFEHLEANVDDILKLDPLVIEKIVFQAVHLKAGIVGIDELEHGQRRLLNFGHTLGHAVESIGGRPHGEAVSIGMAAAAAFSVERGYLQTDEANRIVSLLERLGLPTKTASNPDDLLAALRKDKKRTGDMIHFILLTAIGEAIIEKMPLEDIERICQISQNRNFD